MKSRHDLFTITLAGQKTGRLLPPKHYAVSCVLRNAAADVEPLVPGRMIAPDRGLFFHSDYEKWTGILNTLR